MDRTSCNSRWLKATNGLIVIRLDQVLMVSLTSASELAFYAVAASLAELPLAVVAACRDVAFSAAAERDNPAVIGRFCRLTVLAVLIACIAGGPGYSRCAAAVFRKEIHPGHWHGEDPIPRDGRARHNVCHWSGSNDHWANMGSPAIQLAGAALTVVLIFAFVPRSGGVGAAVVTTLTYAVLACASLFVYLRASGLTLRECLVPTKLDVRDVKASLAVVRLKLFGIL